MKLKRLLRYGCLLVSSLILIWLGINRIYKRPYHTTDPSLLAPSTVFPVAWGEGKNAITAVTWEEGWLEHPTAADVVLFDPAFRGSWFSSAGWGIGNHWRAQGPLLPYLNQEASQYPSVVEAILKYQMLSPGDSATWSQLPFHGVIQIPALTPKAWSNPSRYASAQRALCAVGTVDTCELWYGWIRYGQYIYQVILLTPGHGMNESTFYQLVQDIDAQVGAKY